MDLEGAEGADADAARKVPAAAAVTVLVLWRGRGGEGGKPDRGYLKILRSSLSTERSLSRPPSLEPHCPHRAHVFPLYRPSPEPSIAPLCPSRALRRRALLLRRCNLKGARGGGECLVPGAEKPRKGRRGKQVHHPLPAIPLLPLTTGPTAASPQLPPCLSFPLLPPLCIHLARQLRLLPSNSDSNWKQPHC